MEARIREKNFAILKRDILDRINSWDDLYTFFDDIMAAVCDTMLLPFAVDAAFVMYAFMQSMREQPDEGDVKVLVEKMLYILVFESKEKLGAEISVSSVPEIASAEFRATAMAEADEHRDPKSLH